MEDKKTNPLDEMPIFTVFSEQKGLWFVHLKLDTSSKKKFYRVKKFLDGNGIYYTCGSYIKKNKQPLKLYYLRVLNQREIVKLMNKYGWKTNQQRKIDFAKNIFQRNIELSAEVDVDALE